ncbi:hypothetical protein BKA65DRAFT_493288 [Rhexocercosporidium sp. MPI-PUGE-AT-0058]|nr:hypothetical protein BKA65DRAFT_493288 [Rhexocercosporidium sp. MPI-PUGE-AT-0058]
MYSTTRATWSVASYTLFPGKTKQSKHLHLYSQRLPPVQARASLMAPDIRTLESELPTDQASILQDLANGAAAAADAADESAEDPNGLETSFQEDLEDPAALLESLANYAPPSPVIESRALPPPPVHNDLNHFESLLQAAATAEGVEAAEGDLSQRSFDPIDTNNKRKRGQEDASADDSKTIIRKSPKRRKKVSQEDADQLALERELWGPEEGEDEYGPSTSERHVSPVPTAGARAAGLHSATALFRRPSVASKKYTRAPMSKLFTSLELTAEQFLHLQAAAKNYMLDPNHPERSDCIGSRGRADTDMVKLKLFACVKSFLEDEGWGARCFTEDVEEGKFRKLKWPKMKNKIISLVTPLMRRMVTNERQRLYALETRNEKRSRVPVGREARLSQTPTAGGTPQPESRQVESVIPTRYPVVDPKLNDYHYNLDLSYQANENGQINEDAHSKEADPNIPKEVGETGMAINYLVNLMHHGRRVHPQVTLTPSSCPGFASLIQHIHNMMDGLNECQQPSSIKVLGPTGLVMVNDEDSWNGAIASVQQTEWLDGEAKCVVQVVDRAS